MRLVSLVAASCCSLVTFSQPAKAHCTWQHPGHCVKDVAETVVVVTTPSVVVDVVTGQDIGTTAENVVNTADKAVNDTVAELGRAVDNTVAESGRAVVNINEAGLAIGRYVERQITGVGDTVEDTGQRLSEGKIVDAFWHAATDPIKNQERGLAAAAQESSLLNTIAATAAAAYGGPGGSAAYASWYAYRASGGDAELALRVGLLAGATSVGMSAVGGMASDTAGEVVKKAIVAGSLGGLAVAAAGGDEEAIQNGFLLGGGMILVQEGYQSFVGGELDARAAKGEPYCMASVGAECSPNLEAYVRDDKGMIVFEADGTPKVDITKTDFRRPHVGTWAKAGEMSLGSETSPVMQSVAQVPGMNAMSVFHDHWSVTWDMGTFTNVASIAPAIVVTYIGTEGPLQNTVIDAEMDDR